MYKNINNLLKKLIFATFLVLLVSLFAFNSLAKEYIVLGSGGTGGTYFPISGGMAEILNKYLPDIEATTEVTGASIENCRLIDSNEHQFAQADSISVYLAYHGLDPFERKMKIKSVFNMHPSVIQFVVLKSSGIKTIEDFKGKRVIIGPPGGGTYISGMYVIEAHNLTIDDFKPMYLSFAEGVTAMKDGLADVLVVSSSAPNPSIMELATSREIDLIPVSQRALEELPKEAPFLIPGIISGGMYAGVDKDISAFMRWNLVVCNPDLDEELVYKATELWFEHKDYLVKIHPVVEYMTFDVATQVPIPLHKGAARYFRDKGVINDSEFEELTKDTN